MTEPSIAPLGPGALYTDDTGHRWRVVDLWSDRVLRVLDDSERSYAQCRLFLSHDGDGRKERWIYYHPDAPGFGTSRTFDLATVAAQLRRSKEQGLRWPRSETPPHDRKATDAE